MAENNDQVNENQQEHFLRSLEAFTRDHKASHWTGTLSSFLSDVLPANSKGVVRSSHQYIWDMIRWTQSDNAEGQLRTRLFSEELFAMDVYAVGLAEVWA